MDAVMHDSINRRKNCHEDKYELHDFSPLKMKIAWVTFKDSIRTAKKTQHFTVTKINWLTQFKEIIAVYSKNTTEHIKYYMPTTP
jgi:hypothetical protein